MSNQEASQRVRIAQTRAGLLEREKKYREVRWKSASKVLRDVLTSQALPNLTTRNVNTLNPLRAGCFVIARNETRTYIGEILDLYKMGNNSKYGYVESTPAVESLSYLSVRVYLPLVMAQIHADVNFDDYVESPIFSCIRGKSHLHTHLPADQVLYHLGKGAFTTTGFSKLTLTNDSEKHWLSLTSSSKVREVVETLPKIKIPGGKMNRTVTSS